MLRTATNTVDSLPYVWFIVGNVSLGVGIMPVVSHGLPFGLSCAVQRLAYTLSKIENTVVILFWQIPGAKQKQTKQKLKLIQAISEAGKLFGHIFFARNSKAVAVKSRTTAVRRRRSLIYRSYFQAPTDVKCTQPAHAKLALWRHEFRGQGSCRATP